MLPHHGVALVYLFILTRGSCTLVHLYDVSSSQGLYDSSVEGEVAYVVDCLSTWFSFHGYICLVVDVVGVRILWFHLMLWLMVVGWSSVLWYNLGG